MATATKQVSKIDPSVTTELTVKADRWLGKTGKRIGNVRSDIPAPAVSEVKLVYKTKVKASDRKKINGAQDAFDILYEYWDRETIEHVEEFKIILLNRANMVLGIASLFKGGVVGTVIDNRVIFQYALKANAAQIILAHYVVQLFM